MIFKHELSYETEFFTLKRKSLQAGGITAQGSVITT